MKNIANRILIGFIIVLGLFTTYLFLLKKEVTELNNQKNMDIMINTGDNVVEISSNENNMEESNIIVPDGIDEYFGYILEYGVEGEDYLEQELEPAPSIKYKEKQDNNDKIIYPYIKNNILHFIIPYTSKNGYIAFITNREIASTRDFLLGINGSVVGSIRKDKSLSKSNNIYLYEMSNVVMAGTNGKGKDLYKYIKDNGKLDINAYVGEIGNYVEKIIIFFK